MKIITANLNGIRSAASKGFFPWMKAQNADVICIQETKSQEHQLVDECFRPEGYFSYFFDAKQKGYSGVAVYSRHQPDNVSMGLGWKEADEEGRYLQVDFGNISVASLYMPSGTSGEERQSNKFDFLDRFKNHLIKLKDERREFIIVGDFNIAHKQIDLKNWRANQKNSGFLPDERAWLDCVFSEIGYVDAFREINTLPDQYTWWSNRGQAWAKNVGWRIDYQMITPGLKPKVQSAEIYKAQRFSDHAPLIIEYAGQFNHYR